MRSAYTWERERFHCWEQERKRGFFWGGGDRDPMKNPNHPNAHAHPPRLHCQPSIWLQRHAMPWHGHQRESQPPYEPSPELHLIRPYGHVPGLLRDPHVVLGEQHREWDEHAGQGAHRDIAEDCQDVGGVWRDDRVEVASVREGVALGASWQSALWQEKLNWIEVAS